MGADDGVKDRVYVSIFFDLAMLRKIDEFRWKHRLPSRTEAVRRLIAFALKNFPKPE